MANFLLTYHGGKMPDSPEEGAKVMAAWAAWFEKLGSAVVDGGNPTSQARAISPDGSVMDATTFPSGYSVISADSMDAAVEATRGCPVLADGAVVVVSETFNAM
ncbi:MAG: YciI family protein [Verrucomicrobiota bacterium]